MKKFVVVAAFAASLLAGNANADTLGTTNVSTANNGSFINVTLDSTGLNYLNNVISNSFAFGGSYSGSGYVFGYSNNSLPVVLTLLGTNGVQSVLSTNTGWYNNSNSNIQSNKNYIAGESNGQTYRDFFVFNAVSNIGTVLAATLQIFNPGGSFSGVNGSGVFSLHNFNGSIAALNAGGVQPGMYNALGGQAAVPGPVAGAGLPVVAALMGFGLWRRRSRAAA